MTVNMTKAGHF